MHLLVNIKPKMFRNKVVTTFNVTTILSLLKFCQETTSQLMSKRKLNRRQKWRIEKIQAEKASRADRKEKSISKQKFAGDLSDEQKGLIIAHYGQKLDVEALEGEDKGMIYRGLQFGFLFQTCLSLLYQFQKITSCVVAASKTLLVDRMSTASGFPPCA